MNIQYNLRHKKPTRLKWYFIAGALALSSSLPMVQAGPDGPVKGPPDWLKELPNDKSQRVIVRLTDHRENRRTNSPFKATGTEIKQTQKAFFSLLVEYLQKEGIEDPVLSGSSIKVFDTVNAVALEGRKATLLAISNNPFVAEMQIDRVSKTSLSESVPLIGASGAEGVWNMGYSGEDQTVVILDTGVDKTHPDLAGKVVSEACYSTKSVKYSASVLCPNKTYEQVGDGAGVDCDEGISGCGHGTHVAGIAAANGVVKGVAKDAKLISMQVFSRVDDPNYCGAANTPCALSFESDQMAALGRVLKLHEAGMKIAAVNMSLGSGKYLGVCDGGMLQYIIDRLHSVGIATIAASGNNGYTHDIASPACIGSAIAVGATKGATKDDKVAEDYSNSAEIIDLLAPGSFIYSTGVGGGTQMKSGTSMAAPHVAGAFAILKSAVPNASVEDILSALKETGTPITDSRNDIIKPRINLKEALERLAPGLIPRPPSFLVPNISVAPNSYDFGDVTVGESSTVKTLTVSNTGNGELDIGQINLSSGDFSISSDYCSYTTVAAGDNCTVEVTFAPQTAGEKNATLSILSNDPDTATATVTLTGNGVVPLIPNISVIPTSHNFGNVTVGESSTVKTLTVSNTGNGDLDIGQINIGGGDFSINGGNCSNTTVAAGANCTVKVAFVPQTAGAKNATLSILSNDPDTATATVTLTGNGVAPLIPNISVTPTSLDFGNVTVGDSSVIKTLTVSNTGNGELDIGQISLGNGNFSKSDNCSNTTVAAGAYCTVEVTFAPQTAGVKNATLSILSNDPDTATATVTLTGNGVAPLIPNISVTPTSLDFGNVTVSVSSIIHDFGDVTVGNSSTVKTLTVSNTGNGDLNIGKISLNNKNFAINRDNCSNTTVAAGANCTVEVTFVPQTTGVKNATLSIPSNDPDTATAMVTLRGNGVVPLIPNISVTPTSLDFGNVVAVGDSSTVKTLTVSNTGNGNLEIGQISLGGGDFIISSDNCSNMMVAPAGTCTVGVTFAPQTEGIKNVTMSILSNALDTFTVTLKGEGIIDRGGMPTDPAPASCQLYAVNDKGLNNSQFFTISLPDLNVSQLDEMCDGCDIEALAIHPETNIIYAASGDDATNGKKGHLYTVDGKTGQLTSVGSTGFNEIEGLAFNANGSTLWAWAKGNGMITITLDITGTHIISVDLVISAPDLVEDIALSRDTAMVFYGAIGTELWMYDVLADKWNICTNLPSETEALERLSDGLVLIGTHKNKTLSLHVFNPITCQIIVEGDILVDPFDDVEGIALPIEACSP